MHRFSFGNAVKCQITEELYRFNDIYIICDSSNPLNSLAALKSMTKFDIDIYILNLAAACHHQLILWSYDKRN